MSNVVDPSTGVSTPIVTHMYETLFFLTLLAADGHHWAIRALSESYNARPSGSSDRPRASPLSRSTSSASYSRLA